MYRDDFIGQFIGFFTIVAGVLALGFIHWQIPVVVFGMIIGGALWVVGLKFLAMKFYNEIKKQQEKKNDPTN